MIARSPPVWQRCTEEDPTFFLRKERGSILANLFTRHTCHLSASHEQRGKPALDGPLEAHFPLLTGPSWRLRRGRGSRGFGGPSHGNLNLASALHILRDRWRPAAALDNRRRSS
ncbi:hypothetical protein NL676_035833 [Syzygium grande]|nr:hypothetical protein NL676_035833 [Syzygium grande]